MIKKSKKKMKQFVNNMYCYEKYVEPVRIFGTDDLCDKSFTIELVTMILSSLN